MLSRRPPQLQRHLHQLPPVEFGEPSRVWIEGGWSEVMACSWLDQSARGDQGGRGELGLGEGHFVAGLGPRGVSAEYCSDRQPAFVVLGVCGPGGQVDGCFAA